MLAAHAPLTLCCVAPIPERPNAIEDGVRAGGKGCIGCLTFVVYAFVALFVVMVVLAAIGKGGF